MQSDGASDASVQFRSCLQRWGLLCVMGVALGSPTVDAAEPIAVTNPDFDAVNAVDFTFRDGLRKGDLIPDGTYASAFGEKVPLSDASNGSEVPGAAASARGWTLSGSGGVIHSSASFPKNAPEGSAGFLLISGDAPSTLFQTLQGIRLRPDTSYTLTVQVFDRDTTTTLGRDVIAFPEQVSIQLLAGTKVLAKASGNSVNGGGEVWKLSYRSPTDSLPVDDLTIALSAAGFSAAGYANAQVVFDNMRLEFSTGEDSPPAATPKIAFFESRIRPVLEQHCLKCHSVEKRKGGLALDHREGWVRGGDSGPAIVAGKPAESLLASALKYDSFEMPPDGRLPDDIIADFEQWISDGAVDPRTRPPSTTKPADDDWEELFAKRRQWWSLQPLKTLPLPDVRQSDWPRDGLDRFVLHALEARNLQPAPAADRRTLARRLSFAIIGLPPDADEVDALVEDRSPDALSRYVDKLLASPHFGERWARHWMDVVHYADTHGYEWDIPAKHAWRYRDYLIRAFNADVPYSQLVLEHVAGDLLEPARIGPEGTNESMIAPMALRLGERRHGDNGSAIAGGVTEEAIDNTIDTLTKGFLGTTVGCSQCHNHKLDAVSQHDYYALAGALSSSRWVVRSVDSQDPNQTTLAAMKELKAQIRDELSQHWRKALEQLPGKLDSLPETSIDAQSSFPGSPVEFWNVLRKSPPGSTGNHWQELRNRWTTLNEERRKYNQQLTCIADFTGETVTKGWQIEGLGMQTGLVSSGELVIAGEGKAALQHLLPMGRWTHVWSQRLGGAVRGPLMDGWAWPSIGIGCTGGSAAAFGLIVDHALFPEERMTFFKQSSLGWLQQPTKVGRFRTYFELSTKAYNNNFPPRVDLSPGGETDPRSWFGITRVYAVSTPQDELARFAEVFAASPAPGTKGEVAIVLGRWLQAMVDRWQNRLSTDEEVATLNGLITSGILPNEAALSSRLQSLVERYRQLEAKLEPDRTVGSIADFREGRNERVRIRGSYTDFGDEVPRGNIRLLESKREPAADVDSGRMAIARNWASPDNPLTGRVMVNRVWNILFGEGLVRTPDDFGHLGSKPSHPELLDWLAKRFIEDGWSVKKLVRSMVLSSTWQQSGTLSGVASTADPENLLWHHRPPRRLDAEAIRDSLLAVSGRLDASMFGPPIEPFRAAEDKEKRLLRGPLDGLGRRSIYLKMTLMEPPRFLALFNQPIPKQTVGHRDVTNVPDQALVMLNDPFVLAMAQHWAEAVRSDDSGSIEERAGRMFRRALGRPPQAVESRRLVELACDSARLRQLTDAQALASADVWRDVAHAIFNLKEFIYLP